MSTPDNSFSTESFIEKSRIQLLRYLAVFILLLPVISRFVLSVVLKNKAEIQSFLFEGTIFTLGLTLAIYIKKGKSLKPFYWIMTALAFFGIFFLTTRPLTGVLNNKNSYILVFPLIAFFLLGKRKGLLLTVIYTVVLSGRTLQVLLQVNPIDWNVLYTFIQNIIVASVLIYFFTDAQEKAEVAIRKRQDELEKEIEERKKIQDELERMNKLMIGRELAMADMKKKMEEMKGTIGVKE